MKYDLTIEPWIPVQYAGGVREVSLIDLFAAPTEFRDLAVPFGPERMAVMRILVAIVQSATPGPLDHDLKVRWLRDPKPCAKAVGDYLEEWRPHFDLFDSERPFMQQPIEPDEKDGLSVAALGLDMASGNNVTLFDHHVDSRPPAIEPGRVARMLLTTLLCQPGGGVSKPFNRTDSPGTKALMVMALGGNLWETLVGNCPDYAGRDSGDAPAWERDPGNDHPDPYGTTPAGWLDFATWRSRAVQLIPDPADGLVRRLRLRQHLKLAEGPPIDPFVPVRRRTGEEPVALRPNPALRLWQQAEAIYHGLTEERQPKAVRQAAWAFEALDLPLRIFVVGLEVNQAKISDSRGVVLPISDALLSDPERVELVGAAAELAKGGESALFAASKAYCKALATEGGNELARRWQEPFRAVLGQRFPRFVDAVASAAEAPDRESDAWKAWNEAVRAEALRRADQIRALQGGTGRGLRAQSLARRALIGVLSRKVPSFKGEKEVVDVANG